MLPHACHRTKDKTAVVLWMHGGCFTNGDRHWSSHVVKYLTDRQLEVYTVDLPQGPDHPWPEARQHLVNLYRHVQQMNPNIHVHVGGESSGAFFAYDTAVRCNAPRCVMLCPVLDPWKRYQDFGPGHTKSAMQLAYFGTTNKMASASFATETADIAGFPVPPRTKFLSVLGAGDADACLGTLNTHPSVTVCGTHALCSHPSEDALRAIANGFIDE